MDTIPLGLRDTARTIRRDPLYAGAVIATLALTLGACTAVFSIVNGVLLRPLAYPEGERLVSIREVVSTLADKYPTLPVNARHFDAWRDQASTFASMAALDWRATALTGAGDPAQVRIVRTSGTLFEVLQMPVALGRPLSRADERLDHPPVTVIAHALWKDRFGGDPQVLGRGLTLGGAHYTIVGVLQQGAELPSFDTLGESASVSTTFAAVVPFRLNLSTIGWMGQFNYPVVGRLNPGVTQEQALAELDVLQRSVAQIVTREAHQPVALRGWMMPLGESIVGSSRLGLLLLLGAVASVVLIACANLANLSLTRALRRMRDAAVRSALGASRMRLVGAVVREQLLLALMGAALGLLLAHESLDLFVRTAPVDLPRIDQVVIDWRVVGFSAIAAVGTGLLIALLPAWRIGRGGLEGVLRAGIQGAPERGGLPLRSILLAVQVALSVSLLVVTGLFVTSFTRLLRVDPGFSADQVVAAEIAPSSRRYPDVEERAALYDRIMTEVRSLNGIVAAAWTSALPLTGETWVDAIGRLDDGAPFSEKPSANYRFVGPEYFRALSMPVTRGRSFEDRDRSNPLVPAVISARAAETVWPGEEAIGRRFTRGDPSHRFEVVGVVADGRSTTLEAPSPLMVYVPYWHNNEGKSVLMVRTHQDPTAMAGEVRRIVRRVDPEIAIADIRPLQHVVDRALAGRRYQMWLFTAFGMVALLIATVGVYATTAYGVSRRRREMNIRVALGARASQVFGLVLRQTATALFVGIAAGSAGAFAIGSVIANLLFEVRASDPLVMAAAVALVGVVGVSASAAAARQGLRIDPAAALRDE